MTKPMAVFVLTSENVTGVGGPMGTARIWDNWRKIFHDLSSAKEYAEKDYYKQVEHPKNKRWCYRKGHWQPQPVKKLTWYKDGAFWTTEDLGFVMYHIRRTNVL